MSDVTAEILDALDEAMPVQPVQPVQPPVAKRKFVDVAVHTTGGTIIHRYEELASGQLKKIGELTPEQAAQSNKPDAPKAAPKAD